MPNRNRLTVTVVDTAGSPVAGVTARVVLHTPTGRVAARVIDGALVVGTARDAVTDAASVAHFDLVPFGKTACYVLTFPGQHPPVDGVFFTMPDKDISIEQAVERMTTGHAM